MSYRTHLKVVGGALVTLLYAVAGLFAAAIFAIPAIPPLLPLVMLSGAMALATAYGATVLLRALIDTLREEKRREMECDMCGGTGYSGDSAVPNGGCWDCCLGTGLINGGEQ